MKNIYPAYFQLLVFAAFLVFFAGIPSSLNAQIDFTKSNLDFNGFGNVSSGVTSLMYGPDGRLYIAEYPGTIKILTIQRNSSIDYAVTDLEQLTGVSEIVNHDDDGTENATVTQRETTGLTVAGTAANPVIYVSSSDFRIGGGPSSEDEGLDTNSGIITRFSWNGATWNVVDIVRGLPRSEENHATNGLEFVTVNGMDYLIVASGGITNGGSPSNNFSYTQEYALSGAILSVNLDLLNGMGIKTDGNGRKYIYDLPTLDDPTRANVGPIDPDDIGYTGVDINDPFGGNDGLNQAMIVAGGPVQIFSPGYRNSYDLVVTQSGAVYATDNGANAGWGGFPENEGTVNVTNNYVVGEPGSNSPSGGEQINNEDHLQLITTDIQSYSFGSYYGGHPNPTRANPTGAGIYYSPDSFGNAGAVFRTQLYDPDGSTPGSTTDPDLGLPANWGQIVPAANSVEGDWRGPGINNPDGPDDDIITTWSTNTNGIDEYTASNFGGAMQGDLLAGRHNGTLHRVELNANGSLKTLTSSFQTLIGGDALGVSCNSDTDIFPGTIWIGTLNGKIVVFEPGDFGSCMQPGESGYDANADYDGDGYSNQDEEDNSTDHCNPASQPNDFDKVAGGSLISDLNDLDDDADGIADANDPFQLGDPSTTGSDAFILPLINNLIDQQGLGGYIGLGMTGLMNNGNASPNWLNWIDVLGQGPNPDDDLNGTAGYMTMHMTSGTALATSNTQEKAFQYGIQLDQNSANLTVSGKLINLSGPLRLYDNNTAVVGGELGYFIGDGTQSNYIKIVITTDGITALQEINDVAQTPINIPISIGARPTNDIVFYFNINTGSGQVELQYSIDSGAKTSIGTLNAQAGILNAIQQSNTDLALGFIGTSNTPGVELEGTWDFLNAIPEGNSFTLRINAGGPQVLHNGKTFMADQLFQGGVEFVNASAQVPELFQSERTASPPAVFDYQIPVTNGDYTVILHFAEIYWGATGGGPGGNGQRIFDVSIEDALVLDNYDIIADVGSETTVAKSFDTTVSDGVLNLNFSALPAVGGINQPKVSAIEIFGSSNASPVAVASAIPLSGTAPLEVSFTGSNSTDDVAIVSYLWDFKDGTPTSSLANPIHTFTAPNTYIVELTVEDNEGLSDTTTIAINVSAVQNEAPVAVATATPTSGTAPLEVSFTASNSTDDVAVVSYLWDFLDGSSTSTEENPTHTFVVPGTYVVELRVEDGEGLTDTTTISIVASTPGNDPPVAILNGTPLNGEAPLEVNFNGSNSTDDEGVVSYLWNFDDGSPSSTEESPTHIFVNTGEYEVSLTVADIEGLEDTKTISVTVVEEQLEENIKAMLIVNPAKEIAQILLIDNGPAERRVVKIYLHDSGGRLIALYNPGEIFAHGLFEIPISTLTDGGVYYIGFEMNKGDKVVLSLIVKH